ALLLVFNHATADSTPYASDPLAHWAYQPLQVATPPSVHDRAWVRDPIDQFILAKIEEAGLRPAAAADKRTLIRRVTFDLVGLPPTPEEIDAFLSDESPGAFDRVVDRLLASPQYGERWGRHWLDVVRYTDSFDSRASVQTDPIEIWRYRDWVVQAMNDDMPYDQFLEYQIAGDLIPATDCGFNRDGLIATGMLAIGNWPQGDADKQKMVADIVDDQVDVVTRGFLGLTISCARCHDHKFDPFKTEDYYGLAGIFFSTSILPGPGQKTEGSPILHLPLLPKEEVAARAANEARLAELRKELDALLPAERKAWAASESAKVARYMMAAFALVTGDHSTADAELHPQTVERWARFLGLGAYPVLNNVGENILDLPGVHARRGSADNPSAVMNTTDREVRYSTITQPARTLVVHPSPTSPAGAAWRSPIHGTISIGGRLADADLNCGDGVGWKLELRHSGIPATLAEGVCKNAGETTIPTVNEVPVNRGDLVILYVTPNAEFSCDTTVIDLTITSDSGETWELTPEISPVFTEGNPWPDHAGNAAVWWLFDARDTAAPDPLLFAPWRAALDEVGEERRGDAALSEAAAMVQAVIDRAAQDPVASFAEACAALAADAGPFWVDVPPAIPDSPRASIEAEIRDREAQIATPLDYAVGIQEGGVPGTEHEGIHDVAVHHRGDYNDLGDIVPRHMPNVFGGGEQAPITEGSGRLELARWVTGEAGALAARVMVNRIWMHHFGQGLVRTPGDFGSRGEAPTHPELLDYLADQFIRSGWSVKAVHRAILRSATYQQSSSATADAAAMDPANRLFARMDRKRLEAEVLRDSMLAVSGQLDLAQGGPAFRDFQTPRRTLYLRTVRSDRSTFTSLFDAADCTAVVPQRNESVVSPQALFMMNHPFVLAQAQAVTDRLDPSRHAAETIIDDLYKTLYGRAPTETETALGKVALEEFGYPNRDALAEYVQVLTSANEFMFVD
ncbi:MAG: DUF1549 and DUF1553 domain-containing protein, partial [Candidatus Hydrogenedentota bacterium]